MLQLLASFLFTAPMNHLAMYGFLIAAVPLLGFVALDLRRAAKASAAKKNSPMQFMSRYRDESGMPIFFEAGEDPSTRSAHRVLTHKRRNGEAN